MLDNADKQNDLGLLRLIEIDGLMMESEEEIVNIFFDADKLLHECSKTLGKQKSGEVLGEKDDYGRFSKAQIFVLDRESGQFSVLPLSEKDVVGNVELIDRQNGFNHVLDKMLDVASKSKDGFSDRLVFQFVPSDDPDSCFRIIGREDFKKLGNSDSNLDCESNYWVISASLANQG